MSLRLVRSPEAPKMTMAHSGICVSNRRGSWKGFSKAIVYNISRARGAASDGRHPGRSGLPGKVDRLTPAGLPLAALARRDLPVELGRAVPRHAKRLPAVMRQVLRQHHNLPHMQRVMRHLAVDRLHYGMRFAADGHTAPQIRIPQRLQRPEHAPPAVLHIRSNASRVAGGLTNSVSRSRSGF